jgi:TPR repeat protein
MYYTGDTVDKDVDRAIKYLEEIDVSSRPIAYRYLGDIYQNRNTPADTQKARIYYEHAASHDDLDAYHSLAFLIHREKDVQTAFQYYTYTASLGHPLSQYMLGTIYANGELGKRDIIKAYAWFSLAAQQGLDIAIAAQKQLNKNMTLSDVHKSNTEIINIKNTITGKTRSPLKDKIEAQKNLQAIAASPHQNRKPRAGRGQRSR